MTTSAELPDEIWASTLVVTDDDPNMVMGFWGPRRFKDGVRYILADLYDAQASEIAAHKLHIEKLYSKLENRAREFSPGDKS